MKTSESVAPHRSSPGSEPLWERAVAILDGQSPVAMLLGIVVVAVSLRLGSALAFGDTVAPLPGVYDQLSYDALAGQVLAGHGFTMPADWWPATPAGEPTAHWSYLYTLYLAGVYALFGHDPLAARLIQAVLAGFLSPLLTWRIACRLFGVRVGLAAAGLAAVYGYFVYYAGALMTETFYILAVLWTLDVATRMARHPAGTLAAGAPTGAQPRAALPSVKHWLLLGMALGTAALLRQVILLLIPLVFAWLLWAMSRQQAALAQGRGTYPWRSLAGGLLATSLVIAVLIGPWTVRNYHAFGQFVLLNTNAGFALFWANHPIHGTSFTPILHSGVYARLIPEHLRGLNEAALDQALLREGLQLVVDDPLRYGRLSASRAKDYFQFWPSPESVPFSNLARVLSFGICLPLMLYGLVLSAIRFRTTFTTYQQSTLVLLYLFVLAYSAIHLLSWALVRYRLPVDAALLPFAGLALVDLAERLSRKRHPTARNAEA